MPCSTKRTPIPPQSVGGSTGRAAKPELRSKIPMRAEGPTA